MGFQNYDDSLVQNYIVHFSSKSVKTPIEKPASSPNSLEPKFCKTVRRMPNWHLRQLLKHSWNQTSVSGLRALRSRVRNRTEPRKFSPKRPGSLWSPFLFLFSGNRTSFSGLKRPGREADNAQLPPRSTVFLASCQFLI